MCVCNAHDSDLSEIFERKSVCSRQHADASRAIEWMVFGCNTKRGEQIQISVFGKFFNNHKQPFLRTKPALLFSDSTCLFRNRNACRREQKIYFIVVNPKSMLKFEIDVSAPGLQEI